MVNFDLTEFAKLVRGLNLKGVKMETVIEDDWGAQVIVYDDEGNRLWDAVINKASYGHEKGLLEIMGSAIVKKVSLMGDDDEDDVLGWLTADEILEKI